MLADDSIAYKGSTVWYVVRSHDMESMVIKNSHSCV